MLKREWRVTVVADGLFLSRPKGDIKPRGVLLVMEKTNVLLDKGDVELLGSGKDGLVVLAAGRGGNVLDTGAGSAEDVVDKGEEGVGADGDLGQLGQPGLALFGGEGSGNLLKHLLVLVLLLVRGRKNTTAQHVDGVALVGTLGALLPLDVESTLVETHEPVVGLVTGKTSAVNTALLTSAQTNDLAVQGVADRVGLSVLESDGGDGQIAQGRLGECCRVLGSDDGAEAVGGGNVGIVATLGQVDAVDSTVLLSGGLKLGVHLQDKVAAALLLAEDLESLLGVSGSNNTVRNLTRDDLGSGHINLVRQSNHVAEAGHAVGTTGSGVGLSKAGALNALNVVNHVDLALDVVERHTDGGTGGRDVLEASGGGEFEGCAELLDKGPGIEGVEQVDVAGSTAQNLEGQLRVLHEGGGRLLVGVGAVAQRDVLVTVAGVLLAEELGDGRVVVGSVLKSLEGVHLAAGIGDVALLELGQEVVVVVGVAEDGDARVVLCGGADQGDTANVNLLDGLGDGDVDLGDCVLEGVQVADDIVDLVDVLLGQVLLVRGQVAGEDTGVDRRVQGLDAATQHLGCLCDGRNVPGAVVSEQESG